MLKKLQDPRMPSTSEVEEHELIRLLHTEVGAGTLCRKGTKSCLTDDLMTMLASRFAYGLVYLGDQNDYGNRVLVLMICEQATQMTMATTVRSNTKIRVFLGAWWCS